MCSFLQEDTVYYNDTISSKYFASARLIIPTSQSCDGWKNPNADSGYILNPSNTNWISAFLTEIQHISELDSIRWVTAGAKDETQQDIQLYKFFIPTDLENIDFFFLLWWGHHGDATTIHNRCAMYLWNALSHSQKGSMN